MIRDKLNNGRRMRIERYSTVKDTSPLVSICCITYNHQHFIRQSLEGFLMQETSFRVEILIHDDASTDGTAGIIKEYENRYPGLFRVVYQVENQFSKGANPDLTLIGMATGEYIALCEGDDYWTDPDKLQKQVSFLEQNSGYSACFGGFTRLNEHDGHKQTSLRTLKDNDPSEGFAFTLEEMKQGWYTKTLTAVFRKKAIEKVDFSVYNNYRDIHLYYHLIKNSRAWYFRTNFGVYRIHSGGINSMMHGRINANAAYDCYRELYLVNRDEFTRQMCFYSTVSLFNYNLYNRYSRNTLRVNLRLYYEAFRLFSGFRELRIMIYSFIKRELKDYIKYHI